MPRLKFDETGKRRYYTGVSNVVLFVMEDGVYQTGVPWNGVTAINENPSGGEPSPLWADNIKYANIMSRTDFGATIEAYQCPDEFDECDGIREVVPGVTVDQQPRKTFGFAYKTNIGNDTEGEEYGYEIHVVYNCLAKPSSKNHQTINENVEASTMSWEVATTPMEIPNCSPSSHMTFNSLTLGEDKMKKVIDKLWGTDAAGSSGTGTNSTIILPTDLATLLD